MPSSMIDISDGLAQDLGHILKASRVGAMIDEERIPCRPGAGVNNALYDGEDFELLFTLSPVRARALQKIKDKRDELEYINLRFKNKSFYKFR